MEENKDQSTGILKAAWMIALITILSKFVGFFRDIITAKYYGASVVSDAYFYAYQIPSFAIILLGGVGGPFHSATVAVFSKLIPDLNKKPDEFVNKLYNTFLVLSVMFFSILGLLCYIFANQIMSIIISNGSQELISLASLHLKIMAPVFVVGGIVGIYYGLLITYKKLLYRFLILYYFSSYILIALSILASYELLPLLLSPSSLKAHNRRTSFLLFTSITMYMHLKLELFLYSYLNNAFPSNLLFCGGVVLSLSYFLYFFQ